MYSTFATHKHGFTVVLLLFGLIPFTAGQLCEEKTRPHKTRCDVFYKCRNVPPRSHVWLQSNCQQGLVYKSDVNACVLPEEDWECELEESSSRQLQLKSPAAKRTTRFATRDDVEGSRMKSDDAASIEVVADSGLSSDEQTDDYEASGNDALLLQDTGVFSAEAKEANEGAAKTKEYYHYPVAQPSAYVDPTLAAHLQRLSQLIDGLKQTYQSQDKQHGSDLRPDQLNAFLAHFNIKNKFNSLAQLEGADRRNSSIEAAVPPALTTRRLEAGPKRTAAHQAVRSKMPPETKDTPNNYDNASSLRTSQLVVVNRPGESIVYNLTPPCNEQHSDDSSNAFESQHYPKIPDDALKTVLELSQQLAAAPNVPKRLLSPTYYSQSVVQPQTPFSYFDRNRYNHNAAEYSSDDLGYNVDQSIHGHRQSSGYRQPSTTIIHNNVIPVHVAATQSGEREVVDSYGQSLGRYPPLNADGDHVGELHRHQHHTINTNPYDSEVYLANGHATPAPHYSSVYPAPLQPPKTRVSTTPPESDFPATPNSLADYFTPSQHLNDHNVQHLFEPSERFPTVQGADRVALTHNRKQLQVERPENQQQHNHYADNDDTSTLYSSQLGSRRKGSHTQTTVESSMEANAYEEPSDVEPPSTFYSLNAAQSNVNYPKRPPPLFASYSSFPARVASSQVKPLRHPSAAHIVDGTQLVNIGGNFIRYDVFQNSILPMLGSSHAGELANVEVITCATGVRQPNTTDCTRYYVCSKKDGKILSYSCPPYTAFNSQTRICDAHTYALCSPLTLTLNDGVHPSVEAYQAMQEIKRRHEQRLKAPSSVNRLEQYEAPASSEASQERDMLQAYVQQAAAMASSAGTSKPAKKRKYYCKEGDKIADQTSINSYFVCYKNGHGAMKGHKMACSKGLLFCPSSTMCTLPSKCT